MLVIALLTMVVVMMFLGAVLKLVPTQLGETVHSREKAAAEAAARSGAAYALSRLQADVNWRGNLDNQVVVDLPDLRVVEDRGNIVGDLRASDGTRSQFQIRFNYENGNGATGSWDDSLNDPLALSLGIDTLSLNNLSGNTALPVPAPGSNHRVDSGSATALKTPRYGCLVQIVGFAGRGVTPGSASSRAGCMTADAKVVFGREEMSRYDAVAYFGGGVAGSLAGLEGQQGTMNLSSVDARSPRLRSMGDVTLSEGTLSGSNGSEVILDTGRQPRRPLSPSVINPTNPTNPPDASSPVLGANIGLKHESLQQQRDRWPKVGWADAPKARPSDDHLPAGSFVWRRDGTSGEFVMDYYPENLDGSNPPTTAPTTYTEAQFNQTFPSSVRMDQQHLTLSFNNKLYVEPSGNLNSLRVTYDDTVGMSGMRPLNYFNSSGNNKAILTSRGDVTLDGVSRGTGSVTAEGNVNFQSSSIFEADPGSAVAIYSKGDVNLNPPNPIQTATFNNYILSGQAAGTVSIRSGAGGSTSIGSISALTATTATTLSTSAVTTMSSVQTSSTFSLVRPTTQINAGVLWTSIGSLLSYQPVVNGFSLTANTAGSTSATWVNASTGLQTINWSQTTGYNYNSSTSIFSPQILSLFSLNKKVRAIGFDSAGAASSFMITSPVMLQYMGINPSFPLTSNDIGFSGLIYSQGNLNVNIPNANLFVNGVMCLWGGDPGTDTPGTGGRGKANLNCLNTYFNYDPSYLLADKSNSPVTSARLVQTYFSMR